MQDALDFLNDLQLATPHWISPKDTPIQDKGDLYISKTGYFTHLPAEIYHYRIGKNKAIHKWLSRRKNKGLTKENFRFLLQILEALFYSHKITREIDQVLQDAYDD